MDTAPIAIGIAGLGGIGTEVTRWLTLQAPAGLRLAAVAGRRPTALAAVLGQIGGRAEVVGLDEIGDRCQVLVDCLAPEASAALLDRYVGRVGTVVSVNVCVLLLQPELLDRARCAGTRLIVPSGAVAGLDALRAVAHGSLRRVRVLTRKPPVGLSGNTSGQAVQLFKGNALDACKAWPRNVNIAAALALAGLGGERTEVEIWSDPALQRNVHEVEIDSDSMSLSLRIENLPSAANPRTSAVTALSVCEVLRGLVATLRIGT